MERLEWPTSWVFTRHHTAAERVKFCLDCGGGSAHWAATGSFISIWNYVWKTERWEPAWVLFTNEEMLWMLFTAENWEPSVCHSSEDRQCHSIKKYCLQLHSACMSSGQTHIFQSQRKVTCSSWGPKQIMPEWQILIAYMDRKGFVLIMTTIRHWCSLNVWIQGISCAEDDVSC